MVKLYYKMWKVGLDLLNYNKANRAQLAVYVLVELRMIVGRIKKD